MTQGLHSKANHDLMVAVERLSMQDQTRIVHLIGLLRLAPDAQRERIQQNLRELIAKDPQTRAECVADIDRLISSVESELRADVVAMRRVRGSLVNRSAQNGSLHE